MNRELLSILCCPFCGGRLRLLGGPSPDVRQEEVVSGILGCQCCTYPVIDGIPYLRTGKAAERTLRLLGDGDRDAALFALLGLDETRQEEFARRLGARPFTFRDGLAVLGPEAEGAYLLYRFSDPTFRCGEAVLRTVSRDRRCASGRALDLGGGTGHLTRSLCASGAWDEVLLADVTFWKLWLAKRFVAPACRPVCCDANQPLPFARGAFSLVFCSDAFHYVWSRRLLAGEMARLIGTSGAVVLTHLHNLLCDNPSAGMPLAPADYRALFEDLGEPRLFKESAVMEAVLASRSADLRKGCRDDELAKEPALVLVAARPEGPAPAPEDTAGGDAGRPLAVNPLYVVEQEAGCLLRLRFPSPYYEEEYAACKRYLPDEVRLDPDTLAALARGRQGGETGWLAQRHVLLDLPADYSPDPLVRPAVPEGVSP